jgi:hypothetical protein
MCQSLDQTTVRPMRLLFAADAPANSYSLEMNIGRFGMLSGLPPRRIRGSLDPAGLPSFLCKTTATRATLFTATTDTLLSAEPR